MKVVDGHLIAYKSIVLYHKKVCQRKILAQYLCINFERSSYSSNLF